jgi:hypothetical protein
LVDGGGSGRTIFSKYGKNVLGLPFIMSGDMIFDDKHRRIYFDSNNDSGSSSSSSGISGSGGSLQLPSSVGNSTTV